MKRQILFLFLSIFGIQAATYHWNGTTTDWNIASNWKVGTATSNATMLLLPTATTLPTASDAVIIAYDELNIVPKLGSNVTVGSILINNNKNLDLNGFDLNVVGIQVSYSLIGGFYSGKVINTSSQPSKLNIDPYSGSNTRILYIEVSDFFQFGSINGDLLTINFFTNNSGSNVNIKNATFYATVSIKTPNISAYGCTFFKNVSIYKGAGSSSELNSYVKANTYYGDLNLSIENQPNKNLIVGDDAIPSNFYGGNLIMYGTSQAVVQLTVKNFNFINPVTISVASSAPINVNNCTFNNNIISNIKFAIVALNNPIFKGNLTIGNYEPAYYSGKLTINNIDNQNSNFQNLTLIVNSNTLEVVNTTFTKDLYLSTIGTGVGNVLMNSCDLNSKTFIKGTGAASITLQSCRINNNVEYGKASGTGTTFISSPIVSSEGNITTDLTNQNVGELQLTGDWTNINKPLNISLNGTAGLVLNNLTINQPITAVSPNILIKGGGTYNGDVDLKALNNIANTNNGYKNIYTNWGPATFNAKFKLELTAGAIYLGHSGIMNFMGDFDANCVNGGNYFTNNILLGWTYPCNFYSNVNIDYSITGGCGCEYTYKLYNVKFLGSNPQRLSSLRHTFTQLDIFNFEINKPSNDLIIDKSAFLYFRHHSPSYGTIKLVSGRIINNMEGSNPLLVLASNISSSGPQSYIVGKIAKYRLTTPESFTFPIGTMNKYAPLTITRNDQTGGAIGVEYFQETPINMSSLGTAKDISECEYWKFNNYVCNNILYTYNNNIYKSPSLWPDVSVNITLPWAVSRNCSSINPNSVGLATYNGTLWNEDASTISTGSTVQQGNVVGSKVYTSSMLNNMLVTYAYKTLLKLNVLEVMANDAFLTTNTETKNFIGGQNQLVKVHPDFNETTTLTISGDQNSEELKLKIPMSATGNPTVVNLEDGTPLNQSLYKITGNTVKFYSEPQENTTIEDFTLNSEADGITLNSNNLVITCPTNYTVTNTTGDLSLTKADGSTVSSVVYTINPTNNVVTVSNINTLQGVGSGQNMKFSLKVRDTNTNVYTITGYFKTK